MNWFKKMVIKWIRDDNNSKYPEAVEVVSPGISRYDESEVDMERGLHFSVLPAQGGTVVQLRSYNRKTDRRENSTHVIPDGDDIATSIGHIVSMEILRRPND